VEPSSWLHPRNDGELTVSSIEHLAHATTLSQGHCGSITKLRFNRNTCYSFGRQEDHEGSCGTSELGCGGGYRSLCCSNSRL